MPPPCPHADRRPRPRFVRRVHAHRRVPEVQIDDNRPTPDRSLRLSFHLQCRASVRARCCQPGSRAETRRLLAPKDEHLHCDARRPKPSSFAVLSDGWVHATTWVVSPVRRLATRSPPRRIAAVDATAGFPTVPTTPAPPGEQVLHTPTAASCDRGPPVPEHNRSAMGTRRQLLLAPLLHRCLSTDTHSRVSAAACGPVANARRHRARPRPEQQHRESADRLQGVSPPTSP
jgi:hypothetical protein